MIMSQTTTATLSGKVITGKVRFSYVHVFEPDSVDPLGDKKYSVSLIIDKKDKTTLDKVNKAVEFVKQQAISKYGGKLPAKFKMPLNDGDVDKTDDPAYADSYYLNASSRNKPGVVDAGLARITDEGQLYSGCYGRASITFFAFDTAGNKGIACGLNNLQKLEDGEYLGGRASAESDFSDSSDFGGDDDLL